MIDFFETQKSLPDEFPQDLLENNRNEFLSREISIIVLDDDPTGTQTIFDVPVLTSWQEKELIFELQNKTPLFFILTNSRSLPGKEADLLAFEIGENIQKASEITGRKTVVISRGDSTLRGHYPNEVDALGKGLKIEGSPQILIPAFFQGGRHTLNNIHYVREGDHLIPAAETTYAMDSTFGYVSSDLTEYVQEKSKGKIKAKNVVSITIKDIRKFGPSKVKEKLQLLSKNKVCIVNAFSQRDLDVFVAGFFEWQKQNKPVLFRTAASVIPSFSGVKLQEPLEKFTFPKNGKGGIIVVGSYVSTTSKQLEYLQQNFPVEYLEIEAKKLTLKDSFSTETIRVSQQINRNLENNQIVVLFTSRELIKGSTPEESLQIVNQISKGLVEVVKGVSIRPNFIIAKGGITSSDIATKALKVKKAQVLGQIIPGVPVWQLNDCPQFPKLLYMPFPGNLGGNDAILKAVKKLTK